MAGYMLKANYTWKIFLYDLENDLYERSNLVSDPAYEQVRTKLAVVLKRKIAEAGEDIPKIIPKPSR